MKKHPYAIVSLVLGISSFLPLPLLNLDKALMAVIFGFLALRQIDKSDEAYSGQGLVYAGLALGGIYIALMIHLFFFYKPVSV